MTANASEGRSPRRCAIYTRKSTEEGLDQAFNSLDAQREACEAFIKSQTHEGWIALPDAYDDGGYSGGTLERPALTQLLNAVKEGRVDIIVVYKVDRLSRSLADFVRLVELFDQHEVSFVSVTQQFNTSTSMGRLTLNVLLSFAQFEREVTSERIRDKIVASKKKGMWMGGAVPLGYDRVDKQLIINTKEARTVEHIYKRYLDLGCVRALKGELDADGYLSKSREGKQPGRAQFSRGALYTILRNPLYIGRIRHRAKLYPGQHEPIMDEVLWQKVQDHLARNRLTHRTRVNTKSPSLLASMVFDDRGNVMSPTQSHKGPRRYRYYVSQALLQYREDEAGSVARIPATQLEGLVTGEILSLLADGPRLLSTLSPSSTPASTQELLLAKAKEAAAHWSKLTARKQIQILQSWQTNVTVSRSSIEVRLNGYEMIHTLLAGRCRDLKEFNSQLQLSVPVHLKRSGIEKRLVVSNGRPSPARSDTVISLQKALHKAMTWNKELLTGKVKTMNAVAKHEGVSQRFIAHRIQLAYLAPDIMQRIISGNVPDTLHLEAFKNRRIPLDWQEQRRHFRLVD